MKIGIVVPSVFPHLILIRYFSYDAKTSVDVLAPVGCSALAVATTPGTWLTLDSLWCFGDSSNLHDIAAVVILALTVATLS